MVETQLYPVLKVHEASWSQHPGHFGVHPFCFCGNLLVHPDLFEDNIMGYYFQSSRNLYISWMVVSNIFFIIQPSFGEDFHFDDHNFQRGWFNHQLESNLFAKC